MNGTIASTLPVEEERALIATSLDTLERVTGARPRGWLSIARSQSFATPRLLAEAGVAYMCDWSHDALPVRFQTDAGPIVHMPPNHHLSARQTLHIQHNTDHN